MSYILVTTVKNEEKNLNELINSVLSQTIKPSLWLIINDGSTDNTQKIINSYAKRTCFINIFNMDNEVRDLTWRYHKIMNFGFSYAINLCRKKNISWNFIGVLDGDIIVKSNNYFQFLIEKFNENSSYGILSGLLLSWNGEKFIMERRNKNKPTGAARLIRKETLDKINGYPLMPTADGVMLLKSELSGYKNEWFNEVIAYQTRLTSSIANPNIFYKDRGYIFHYLGYTFLYVFLYSIIRIINKPYFYSILTIYYFIYFKIIGEKRTNDTQVLNYKKSIISSFVKSKLRLFNK